MIFKDQPFTVFSTIKEAGIRVNISTGIAKYAYWKPSNQTDTPDETVVATVIDAETGDIEYDVPASVNDESGNWCFRGLVTFGADDIWSDEGETITVYDVERCDS